MSENPKTKTDLIKSIGITAILTSVWAFIQILAPDKIGSINLDFVINFVQNSWYEAILLAIVFFVWFFWDSVKVFIIKLKNEYRLFSKGFKALVLLTLIVATLGNTYAFYKIMKSRVKHYMHLNASYRFYLHRKLCEKINENNYNEAIEICKRIKEQFPTYENELVNFTEPFLKNRQSLGNKLYEKVGNSMLDSSDIDRIKYLNLILSCSLYPKFEHKQKLKNVKKRLEDLQVQVVIPFYTAIKEKNERYSSVLFKDYKWLLFEEYFNNTIMSNKTYDIEKVEYYLKKMSEADFVNYYRKIWYLDKVEDVLNYKNNMLIGTSDEIEIENEEDEIIEIE